MKDKKKSGPTKTASFAARSSAQGVTADASIVTTAVKSPPTNGGADTFSIGRSVRDAGPIVKQCQNCGDDYPARHPKRSKFCGSTCRREAWMTQLQTTNPEKHADMRAVEKARLEALLKERNR